MKVFAIQKASNKSVWSKKMHSFFFCELRFITVLLLIFDFYMSLSRRFITLKVYVEFSIFDSVSFLLKFIFLFNKKRLLDCKTFTIKIIELWFFWFWFWTLIFKLQQEIWKLNNLCLSFELSKNCPGDELFKLRKFFLNCNF